MFLSRGQFEARVENWKEEEEEREKEREKEKEEKRLYDLMSDRSYVQRQGHDLRHNFVE